MSPNCIDSFSGARRSSPVPPPVYSHPGHRINAHLIVIVTVAVIVAAGAIGRHAQRRGASLCKSRGDPCGHIQRHCEPGGTRRATNVHRGHALREPHR